jgi:hypothetical protein
MALKSALEEYERGGRLTAAQAGYMELEGAAKDGDCRIVHEKGGISKKLGCCNNFQPEKADTCKFSCGTCGFVKR